MTKKIDWRNKETIRFSLKYGRDFGIMSLGIENMINMISGKYVTKYE